MKKRVLVLFLALLMLLSLVGCGEKQEEEPLEVGDNIGGVSLSDCVILTPQKPDINELRTARMISLYLGKMGYKIEVKKSGEITDAGAKILVGNSLCQKAKPEGDHGFVVCGNGTALEVAANSAYGYEAALTYLSTRVFKQGKKVAVDDSLSQSGKGDGRITATLTCEGDLRVMSNNVFGSSGAGYTQRTAMLAEVFETYAPDVLLLQEYHNNIRDELNDVFLADGYAEVSFPGRVLNSGASVNSTPIYFKTDKLELLYSGFMWFDNIRYDEDAYENLRGSYTAAQVKKSDYSKGATYAIFRIKNTQKYVMLASTHLWWVYNDGADDACRAIQIAALKERLLTEAASFLSTELPFASALPILVGGDFNFNSTATSVVYPQMTGSTPTVEKGVGSTFFYNTNEYVAESKRISASTNLHKEGNFNTDYLVYDEPHTAKTESYTGSLDYIFTNIPVSKKNLLQVAASRQVRDLYSQLATDHTPIFTDIILGELLPDS